MILPCVKVEVRWLFFLLSEDEGFKKLPGNSTVYPTHSIDIYRYTIYIKLKVQPDHDQARVLDRKTSVIRTTDVQVG